MTVKPTDAELAILKVLWNRGPSTVREIHNQLNHKTVRYTTTLKQLQVMLDKNLVGRDDAERSHRYYSKVSEIEAQQNLLDHLLEHAFGGSTSNLLIRALDSHNLNSSELEQLKALLKEKEDAL